MPGLPSTGTVRRRETAGTTQAAEGMSSKRPASQLGLRGDESANYQLLVKHFGECAKSGQVPDREWMAERNREDEKRDALLDAAAVDLYGETAVSEM